MLLEVRLSPQLHTWIYGFFPHSFAQQMRFGGFRPVVFLMHGLEVAMFTAMALVATVAVARAGAGRDRSSAGIAAVWLAFVLILCKTFGAILLALVFVPLAALAGARQKLLVIGALAAVILFYPAVRGADLIPMDMMVAAARIVDEERAGSLAFRVDNEDVLLDHANRRPVFGWSGWGRGRVYDAETGQDISVTDGRWIITVGIYGWFGYLAEFGLLTVPLILVVARLRSSSAATPNPYTTGLALVLTINLIDLIPNSWLTPLTWLIAGALLGAAERLAAAQPDAAAPARAGYRRARWPGEIA
jgi:hypothetical protein